MNEDRFVISDAMWGVISQLLPGKSTDRGVTAADNRRFLEAVLWRVRTGARPGVIFPVVLATGTAFSAASADGRRRGCLRVYSRRYRMNRILNTP